MNRSEELVGDALRLLHERGFVPSISENGGKHIKIRWNDARAALHARDFAHAQRQPSASTIARDAEAAVA